MITKILMPKLSETMEEGIITGWLKKEGEKVKKGEPLFEITTDKAAFEVESTATGYLRKILFPVNTEKKIAINKTIAYITKTKNEKI
ncbi:MAG: biotin attachment protein [Elusimicrobia bacterium]|nr:biotin attachment protein [Elusimicrobiota bacterium]